MLVHARGEQRTQVLPREYLLTGQVWGVIMPALCSGLGKYTFKIIPECVLFLLPAASNSHEFLKSNSSVWTPHQPTCGPHRGKEPADVDRTHFNLENLRSYVVLFFSFPELLKSTS